ncbi:hypothetical protein BMETH_1674_0 [methanotrophic bacterial endosymbiont of Bathymodiolus sp.]|nr:hypothetical protein BMETH_1674_0 [methanotrophic bacterial endosymbiont of Bathymodiolus sp.]
MPVYNPQQCLNKAESILIQVTATNTRKFVLAIKTLPE